VVGFYRSAESIGLLGSCKARTALINASFPKVKVRPAHKTFPVMKHRRSVRRHTFLTTIQYMACAKVRDLLGGLLLVFKCM